MMKKIRNFINSMQSNYVTSFTNIILFLICFKQIFSVGKEAALLDLNNIFILPIVYAYSVLIAFFLPFISSKDIVIKIVGILIILGILLTQIQIIRYGGLQVLTIPVLMSLIEVLRNSDSAFNQLIMLVITMLLMFVALFIVRIFNIDPKHEIVYACLYFLYLCYKDYTSIKKHKNKDNP